MSRIGKLPITIPAGVAIKIEEQKITVSGPKGELARDFNRNMTINQEGNTLTVTRANDSKENRSLHGLTRTLLANMVEGVSKGFEKTLEIRGVGYRVEKTGDNLVIRIGFSHPVDFSAPAGITLSVDGTTKIMVAGISKETVGETAAKIRAIRPPDSYKGKGIRYAGETVRLKPGKAGKVVSRT
jgi:large subunit ribosomal protein L6